MRHWVGLVLDLERRWRWRVWWLYLAAWTTALVVPIPDTPGLGIEGVEIDLRAVVAKSLHVTAYALLAVLSGWLRAPYRYRWLLVYFVMVHATATEMIQTYVVYRTGLLTDVAFDHLGIAIGMLCTWKWWCGPEVERDAEPKAKRNHENTKA